MSSQPAHFAIHADDLERARKFCGALFGWKLRGYGGEFGTNDRRPARRKIQLSACASACPNHVTRFDSTLKGTGSRSAFQRPASPRTNERS
jgi:extradiol dioxygenase family protein